LKQVAIFLILIITLPAFGETARQYYNELYKAGGLDSLADGYACFDDDEKSENFFIFGESKHIREFMLSDGTFGKMPKALQDKFKTDFLIVQGYARGVAVGGEDFYSQDGKSWLGDMVVISKQPKMLSRIRFGITWETLRYRRSVEVLNPDESFNGEVSVYGKCENVAPEIRQHGNP
jgi:hypothetical protein